MNKASVEADWKAHTHDIWKGAGKAGDVAKPTEASEEPLTPGMADFLLWKRRQEQVKACPCCNGVARWRMPDFSDQRVDSIKCQDCGLSMTGDYEAGSALVKWNTRAGG